MKANKNISSGVPGGNSKKKAPIVDKNGAWTKIQKRTLGKKK